MIYTFKSGGVCVAGVDVPSYEALLPYLLHTDFAIKIAGQYAVDPNWQLDLRLMTLMINQRRTMNSATGQLVSTHQRKTWTWWESIYTGGYTFFATRVNGVVEHQALVNALPLTARRIDRRLHRVPNIDGIRLWEHLWTAFHTLTTTRGNSATTYIRDFSGTQVGRYDAAYDTISIVRSEPNRFFPRLFSHPPDLRTYNDQAHAIIQALSNPVSTPSRTARRLGVTLGGTTT